MTERKPAGMSYESWIDRQIRTAQERGELDDLPGAGQPIPPDQGSDTALAWVKNRLDKEGLSSDSLLPEAMRLRKEVDRLPQILRELREEGSVRELVELLNQRIVASLCKPADGPRVPLAPLNVDRVVEQWRADRTELEAPPSVSTPEDAETSPGRPARWWRRLLKRQY